MTPQERWLETNTRYLMARWLAVRERLLPTKSSEEEQITSEDFEREALDIAATMDAPPTLDRVCKEFNLSAFERDVLLLCAGVELDPEFNEPPTFHTALANLPDAYWAAITPASPLRFWRLLEVDRGDQTLANSPLRLDERILHYLVGADYLDERLANFFQVVRAPQTMPPSYRKHAERITSLWAMPGETPIIHLTGDWQSGRSLLAAASCAALGLKLYSLNASDIPANSVERETLLRLWQRESLLLRSALLLVTDDADAESLRMARNFMRRVGGLLFVSGDVALRGETVATVEIDLPEESEQRAIWEESLGPLAARLNGHLDEVVSQFRFDPERIRSVGRAVREKSSVAEVEKVLWSECRVESRAPLKELAECIEPKAHWDDLILPGEHLQTLGEIAAQVRQRMKVYHSWGFAERNDRGLGITALFAGPSGTGKTMAAEVLANDLGLDLYRVDLSTVVSKYVGETEKIWRRAFPDRLPRHDLDVHRLAQLNVAGGNIRNIALHAAFLAASNGSVVT